MSNIDIYCGLFTLIYIFLKTIIKLPLRHQVLAEGGVYWHLHRPHFIIDWLEHMFYNVFARYFRFCGELRGDGCGYDERKQWILQRGNCKDTIWNRRQWHIEICLCHCLWYRGGKMKNRKKINWALIILIYFLGLLTNYFLR